MFGIQIYQTYVNTSKEIRNQNGANNFQGFIWIFQNIDCHLCSLMLIIQSNVLI